MLEKSTESIVDGEKDKHMDNREHQTGMDTAVKGAKGYFGHVVRAGEMEDDVMLGRMNGERREEDIDTYGWTHSWGTRAEPPSAT